MLCRDINYCLFYRLGPVVALTLIGIGTGGIKPCVCAFGGDQFNPGQVLYMDHYSADT